MNISTLKSVVVLDREIRVYKPSSHNLTAREADDIAVYFMALSRKVKILDQKKRHPTPDATKCKACKKAADETSR